MATKDRLGAALAWADDRLKRRPSDISRAANDRYAKKALYGLPWHKVVSFRKKHDNKCGICGVPQDEYHRLLCVDHCHQTGGLRGLLCNDCNIGLGHFKDNPTLLEAAIKYLKNKKPEQW